MNFLKYTLITLLSIVLLAGAGYLLASSGVEKNPGYAKLTLPSRMSADTVLSLDLGPGGVKPLTWIIERALAASNKTLEMPERVLMGVLPSLQGLQLRIYETDGNQDVF